jgi:hypothetical protein
MPYTPKSASPLQISRRESAGQMRIGASWRIKGGLPGSKSRRSDLHPLVALPQQVQLQQQHKLQQQQQ